MNIRHLLAAATLAVVATVSGAGPAAAGSPWKITVAGLGTATATSSGGHDYSGALHGTPFAGDFTGSFAADDGTLPALGECEPASATLRVEDEQGRYWQLVSDGQVCAWFLPLGTMHQFTGRWTIDSTNVKKLTRATGFTDIRILNGQSDVYATES